MLKKHREAWKLATEHVEGMVALQQMQDTAWADVINEVMDDIIIPFCKEHNAAFDAGFRFEDEDDAIPTYKGWNFDVGNCGHEGGNSTMSFFRFDPPPAWSALTFTVGKLFEIVPREVLMRKLNNVNPDDFEE